MKVYIIETALGFKWSGDQHWGDHPDIYPSVAQAEKIVYSGARKPIYYGADVGIGVEDIYIAEYQLIGIGVVQ